MVFGFYMPPKAKSIQRWDLTLLSHLKDEKPVFELPTPLLQGESMLLCCIVKSLILILMSMPYMINCIFYDLFAKNTSATTVSNSEFCTKIAGIKSSVPTFIIYVSVFSVTRISTIKE